MEEQGKTLYTVDELIGGSHFHNAMCPACLRFGYVTALTVLAAAYQAMEKRDVDKMHELMDEICDFAGVNKLDVLDIVKRQMTPEENS